MKFTCSLVLAFLINLISINAQNGYDSLQSKLLNADSVLIVSHKATAGEAMIDENEKIHPPAKLIVKNKLNQAIVHEKLKITHPALQNLIEILIRPFEDSVIEMGNCYIPHHTIVIYKNEKISSIEICFSCMRYYASKDLQFNENFDKRKWNELNTFFKKQGLEYEL